MKYVKISLFQSEKRVQSYKILANFAIFAPKIMNERLITPTDFTPREDEIKVITGTESGLHGNIYVLPADGNLPEAVKELYNLAYEWDQTTFYITLLQDVEIGEAARLFKPFLRLYNVRFPKEYLLTYE